MNTQEDGLADEAFYTLLVQVFHPSIDPGTITAGVGLEPRRSWKAGTPRTAANGSSIPGNNRETYWSFSQDATGERGFFQGVGRMLDLLEPCRDFIRQLSTTGGMVLLTVQLPGFINIGSQIEARHLLRFAEMGVSLGIEVFPHMPVPDVKKR